MKVAIIQTSSLPYEKAKINYFLSILRAKKVKLVLIGEYVLNLFFKDLENTPIKFVKDQSNHQIELFKKLANRYNMTLVAPVIIVKKDKLYKTIIKFSPKNTRFYYQQILMPYSHWNEKKLFSTIENKPLIFKIENFTISVLAGFETHFDEFWHYFREKNVDLVLVPNVATFTSNKRWENMLSSFAFLNNCYVLRANRIGNWNDWKFYGESFLANPNGEIVEKLKDKEELLIYDISKTEIKEAKKEWGFNHRKDLKGLICKE